MPLGQSSDLRDLVLQMLRTIEHHGELLDKLAEFFSESRPTLQEIKQVVAEFYDVPMSELTSVNRDFKHAHARLVVYYLARKLTRLSLANIGMRLGERDHTTVSAGFDRIVRRVRREEILRDDLDVLRSRIAEKVLERVSRGRA